MTHGLVGVWAAQLAPGDVPRWKLAAGLGALAVMPDLDIAAFFLGIRYSDMFGHRGLSHSLTFALLAALMISGGLAWRCRLGVRSSAMVFGLAGFAALSHGFLDVATNGGLGVGLLLPFSEERFFLPFRPIDVSPIDPVTFLENAARVFTSEAKWVWMPLAVLSSLYHSGRLVSNLVARNEPELSKLDI